jgi:hypothetical protein
VCQTQDEVGLCQGCCWILGVVVDAVDVDICMLVLVVAQTLGAQWRHCVNMLLRQKAGCLVQIALPLTYLPVC